MSSRNPTSRVGGGEARRRSPVRAPATRTSRVVAAASTRVGSPRLHAGAKRRRMEVDDDETDASSIASHSNDESDASDASSMGEYERDDFLVDSDVDEPDVEHPSFAMSGGASGAASEKRHVLGMSDDEFAKYYNDKRKVLSDALKGGRITNGQHTSAKSVLDISEMAERAARARRTTVKPRK